MNFRAVAVAMLMALHLPANTESFNTWVAGLARRGVKVSAGLWELDSGRLVEGIQTDQALVPASTTKVVSTYALLKTWKPAFTLETEVWGDLKAGVVQGDLVLKGGGDPALVNERIWMLAHALKERGVDRIQGRIRLDQTAFDEVVYNPDWGRTTADTTPPVLPLSINHNRDDRGRLTRDPERLAVDTVTRIFREAGLPVEQNGARETGTAVKLLTWSSPPLRQLVADINKYSNNFMIEMLVKKFGEGTWPGGVQRIQAFYKGVLELGPDQVSITDGSGLSKENHLSARTLAIVLRAAWHDFEVGPEFVASLKTIGGEPWATKIKDPNLARRVRCKTGHLNEVESVCGYLQLPDGQLRVFSILLNGPATLEDVWAQVTRWANP